MSGMSLHIDEKIVPWTFFKENDVKLHNQKIVFTNGCFDVLHFGHVQYLLEAKKLGDLLVVGLNSDASVRRLKGESRPINGENERAFVLAALEFVDYVVVFEEDTPKKLIETVRPNVLVKGGDYQIENIVGADFVMQNGGTVTTIPFVEGFSSTHIIEQLKH
jgi:D-beta-D-heptose 7-phosphate kinase/D-beta-D-heptose 1-phosphate adenosyltransferase